MSSSSTSKANINSTFVCDCGEQARSACIGESFYDEHHGKQYCVLHFPEPGKIAAFEKAIEKKLRNKNFNFRGVWFPNQPPFKNINFLTSVDFSDAFFSRGADFSNTIFTEKAIFKGSTFDIGAGVGFTNAVFIKEADFSSTTFKLGVSFKQTRFDENADFAEAQFFAGAIFESTKFNAEANFKKTTFPANAFFMQADFVGKVYFIETKFSMESDFSSANFNAGVYFFLSIFIGKADFSFAKFNSDVEFNKTDFHGEVIFKDTIFKDYVGFWGYGENRIFADKSSATFQYARLENPEHVFFHTLTLRPHWFVNVDARKFDFTNVDWSWHSINEEIVSLQSRGALPPYRLLAIACRQLAVNAEENHRYEEASKFRYMAMDAKRLEKWWGFSPWRLGWWYWLASGYGERILRAFVLLIGIWLLFALLYTRVGFARWEPRRTNEIEAVKELRDEVGEPLRLPRALTYSLSVMTLQKPEPHPATTAAQSFVILETILGPLQAALLALAIRRKFMR